MAYLRINLRKELVQLSKGKPTATPPDVLALVILPYFPAQKRLGHNG